MAMRGWLLAMAACSVIGAGCGDDGGGDDMTAGMGMTTAGKGMTTAGKSGGGSTMVSPGEAITGACGMREQLEKCMGQEEFTDCALNECGGKTCAEGGCKTYTECVEKSGDPCNNTCTRNAACEACAGPIPDCVINKCLSKLKCD